MVASSTAEAPDSIPNKKPDVNAPTDRIVQQAQAGADNISQTSPYLAKDTTSSSSTDTQARAVSEQMSRGAGIGTTGKTESFQASDGSKIQGSTYTTKDGTFMKVPGGDDGKGSTYQIEQGDNGQRNLSKVEPDGSKEPVPLKASGDSSSRNGSRNGDAAAAAAAAAPGQQYEAPKAPVDKAPVDKTPVAASPDATVSPSPVRPDVPAHIDKSSTVPSGDGSVTPPVHHEAPAPVAASPEQVYQPGQTQRDQPVLSPKPESVTPIGGREQTYTPVAQTINDGGKVTPKGDGPGGLGGDSYGRPGSDLVKPTGDVSGSGARLGATVDQGRVTNPDAGTNLNNLNARQTLDASGLQKPGAEAGLNNPGRLGTDTFAPTGPADKGSAAAEAAAMNAANRTGTPADVAALNAANNRAGAESAAMNAAMNAASKPGSDALAKTAGPADVLAPNASQNMMLRQAGFNANNPADAEFLASARAQLMAGRLGDGTNANTTLANALSGQNPANLNRLAVLLSGKADATANNVVLNEANLARLNALFKPEAIGAQPGMINPLDAKANAALGMTDFVAGRNGVLTQKEIFGELSKLGTQTLQIADGAQKLAMADLISRNLLRPTDLLAGAGLLANKLEPLAAKGPETLVAHPENVTALANALAAARARAADLSELAPGLLPGLMPGKPIALGDLADGHGLPIPIGKGLPADGAIADKIADSRIGGAKPTAITGAEALLNTKAAQDAIRNAAIKANEIEGPGGLNLTLPTRKDMTETGEKKEDPKKKPEVKGEGQGGLSIDGSLLTGAALRLFGDKKDDKENESGASKKVDESKTQRRKYAIKPGDTLDSIAQQVFRDGRMAALIAAVNSEVIAENTPSDAPLEAGLNIWLPSELEVEEFLGSLNAQASEEKLTPEEELARRFGNGWNGDATPSADTQPVNNDLMTAAIAATAKRRENVEKLLGPLSEKKPDYIKYTVRLGDTLKSVATKHPALKDVSLWELVASVNEIDIPGNNPSAVKLTRGSSLRLPTAAEIDQFRAAQANKKPAGNGPNSAARTGANTRARSIVIPPGNPLAARPLENKDTAFVDEHAVTRVAAPITDAGTSLLRAGGFVKDQPKSHDDATIVTAPIENLPRPKISKPITTDKPSVENIKNLSEDCRVVRRHQVDASGRLYQAQLEVLRDGAWTSVMMYNISDGNCWRKSINELGVTEILQLELPTAAIHQMLESDFANNWQEYRDRMLDAAKAY